MSVILESLSPSFSDCLSFIMIPQKPHNIMFITKCGRVVLQPLGSIRISESEILSSIANRPINRKCYSKYFFQLQTIFRYTDCWLQEMKRFLVNRAK